MENLEIIVERKWPKAEYTIGNLSIDGKFICNTIEDTDRGLEKYDTDGMLARKVYGKTAIPKGRYGLVLSHSPKFSSRSWAKETGGKVPELLNVPAFSGVRIHTGNTALDSLGCLIVGMNRQRGAVVESTVTYKKLMLDYIIPAIRKGRRVYITIK